MKKRSPFVMSSNEKFLSLKKTVVQNQISPLRKWGQNFLIDENLSRRIVRSAGLIAGGSVIEIGSGAGALTRALLMSDVKKVLAIECDPRCCGVLRKLQRHYSEKLTVINMDALVFDAATQTEPPRHIVSNLPYNISTPLLLKWLKEIYEKSDIYDSLTIMIQKEVADRLTAKENNKIYGRLSIITQWLCHVESRFHVNRKAFKPVPNVTSRVVHLVPRKKPLAKATFESLEKITAMAFGQRRKMLRSGLKSLNLDWCSLGIEPTLRAENLDIEKFCALARALERPS